MFQALSAAFNSTLTLFIYVLGGFILRKTGIVKKDFSAGLSALLFNLLIPALMLDILTTSMKADMLIKEGSLFLVCTAIIALSYFFTRPLAGLFTKDRQEENTFFFAMIYSNFGFMGLPVIQALCGKEALLAFTFYTMPLYLTVNVLGANILSSTKKEQKTSIGSVLNTVTIAILLGIVMGLLGLKLPTVIGTAVSALGNCVTPLSMLLIGIILGTGSIKEMLGDYRIYLLSAIRLIAIPLLVAGVLILFGASGIYLTIPVMISAMPIAANSAILSEIGGGGNAYLAAKCVFVSTMLSLLTIPIFAAFFS